MKAVSIDHVSKKFILRHSRSRSLGEGLRGFLMPNSREDFWALKDVCIEIDQGDAIGIIGHNGAGKSTMLKILTGIMEPTSGRVRTRGRVSALIEVGAGFHQEMTGRENVYLNGSIIGMSHNEITKKFDAIVAFAQLERFIDMPVKRYSSGMYARLGFSVAAHLDPDILIVDEVLSVGDAAFQKRCLDHMLKLKEGGCTIVFVSHNLQAVATMCTRGAVLDEGQLFYLGTAGDAIMKYTTFTKKVSASEASVRQGSALAAQKSYTGGATIEQVQVLDASGQPITTLAAGSPFTVRLVVRFNEDSHSPVPSFYFRGEDGVLLYNVNSDWMHVDCGDFRAGEKAAFEFSISYLPLRNGTYWLSAEIAREDLQVFYDTKQAIASVYVYDTGTSKGILDLPAQLGVSRVCEVEQH
jgi:ABC-type polysaccharide/polyol phosphate transport system ATPase subunit